MSWFMGALQKVGASHQSQPPLNQQADATTAATIPSHHASFAAPKYLSRTAAATGDGDEDLDAADIVAMQQTYSNTGAAVDDDDDDDDDEYAELEQHKQTGVAARNDLLQRAAANNGRHAPPSSPTPTPPPLKLDIMYTEPQQLVQSSTTYYSDVVLHFKRTTSVGAASTLASTVATTPPPVYTCSFDMAPAHWVFATEYARQFRFRFVVKALHVVQYSCQSDNAAAVVLVFGHRSLLGMHSTALGQHMQPHVTAVSWSAPLSPCVCAPLSHPLIAVDCRNDGATAHWEYELGAYESAQDMLHKDLVFTNSVVDVRVAVPPLRADSVLHSFRPYKGQPPLILQLFQRNYPLAKAPIYRQQFDALLDALNQRYFIDRAFRQVHPTQLYGTAYATHECTAKVQFSVVVNQHITLAEIAALQQSERARHERDFLQAIAEQQQQQHQKPDILVESITEPQ